MHVRPPAATELAESLDMGLLVVVGPEPVEGPFVIGPLVRAAEQWPPSHSPAFTWVFWSGPNRRSVRIEGVQLQPLIRSYGHEGPAKPTTLRIPIDGVPFDFHGERVGDTIFGRASAPE